MRDRLIKILQDLALSDEPCVDGLFEWADSIADHLLAEGVIVPPCKVGDAVYYPSFGTNRVLLYKVISIKLNSKGLYVVCENHLSKSQMTHKAEQIGKTIFLTKEEAERALAERRTNNGCF